MKPDLDALPLALTVEAVRVMTGRQVTDLADFFHRLGGTTPFEEVPPEARKVIHSMLQEMGYKSRWLVPACGGKPVHKLVRPTWPNDWVCLSTYVTGDMVPGAWPVEAYVPFD